MAKSRSLVIGHLERVASTAIERFRDQLTDLLDGQHGIYALYNEDRLYYVGLATDLRRRIKQHDKDRHKGKWNRFSLYKVRKLDHIREIESLVLRITSPHGNRTGSRLRHSTDLRRQLRRSMVEKARKEIESTVPLVWNAKKNRGTGDRTKLKGEMRQGDYRNRLWPLRKLVSGKKLYGTHKKTIYKAMVYRYGGIHLKGVTYNSPTAAAVSITGRPTNGWHFWKVRKNGELVRLNKLKRNGRQ